MRIMIAGTGSGCGKTTVSLAVMRSLMRAGHTVQAFKSGPDYIDPGYHARATGRPSYNLDMFMLSEASIRQIIAMGMEGADTGIIEGAMGYYDGLGAEGACSAHALAVATQTPVVLVIDASGSASSAAAVALGFQTFREKSGIKGYFLNNVSSARHYALVKQAIEARTGLPCVGWLPKNACAPWKSRHLGLIQAAEQQDLEKALEALAEAVVLEEPFFEILSGTKPVVAGPLRVASFAGRQRMGIARDNAFAFYYAADFAMLEGMGFSLEYFSPLRDEAVPSGVDALWLGGGYPELYAERLSRNRVFMRSLRDALEGGLRCYAECGGMMVLGEAIDGVPMAGFLPVSFAMTDRLQRFGYVTCRDVKTGTEYRAHEFHHSIETDGMPGDALSIRKVSTGREYFGGYRKKNVLAAYPHAYLWGNDALVRALWSYR